MSARLKCENCGGSVEYRVRENAATCLFCGVAALELDDSDPPPPPDGYIPLVLDQAGADTAYRNWAKASWWRPAALRTAKIETKPIYLPAWRFVCRLDTHWAGLESAATRSGKRPRTGRETATLEHLVPASGALEPEELTGLLPFDESQSRPWQDDGVPHELPAKSRRLAATEVHAQVQRRHAAAIQAHEGLKSCNVMAEVEDLEARALLLPVYIGVFRFRDRAWRFLVNAQSGEVYGKAPIDRVKVMAVIAAVVLVGLAFAAFAGR